jgi:hypothetical protein
MVAVEKRAQDEVKAGKLLRYTVTTSGKATPQPIAPHILQDPQRLPQKPSPESCGE